MIKKDEIPTSLHERSDQINLLIEQLQKESSILQTNCVHQWNKVTWLNPNYRPRLDQIGLSRTEVIKEFHCPKCNQRKPLEGLPFVTCWLCGGKMKFDRHEQFGMDRASVHKCESCQKEYDTV